jgi:hypothetical protein
VRPAGGVAGKYAGIGIAVACSRLFGAGFEGHGRFAFVRAWLFGACFEGHGRFTFVLAWWLWGRRPYRDLAVVMSALSKLSKLGPTVAFSLRVATVASRRISQTVVVPCWLRASRAVPKHRIAHAHLGPSPQQNIQS